MTTYTGTPEFPLTAMMRDTIATLGLHWAIEFYARRIPQFQLRVLMRSAYLGA